LAKRVGTSAPAICRLEAADYEGRSLYMLKRIAAALDRRVESKRQRKPSVRVISLVMK
jgi:predicted transcriptional regulator